jgi:predicted RNA-binding Zn ribbon-like protein
VTNLARTNVTGQEAYDSDDDVGLATALALVNELAVLAPGAPAETVRRVLAVDPPSVAALGAADVAPFLALAERLHGIVLALAAGDVDTAAAGVNELLAEHPAHPHLAKEGGAWRLHHHPADADVVGMWSAIAADAFARLIGAGRAGRVGICEAHDCRRAYNDRSKNASRRFCTTTCQNRVKATAFRRRRAITGARDEPGEPERPDQA